MGRHLCTKTRDFMGCWTWESPNQAISIKVSYQISIVLVGLDCKVSLRENLPNNYGDFLPKPSFRMKSGTGKLTTDIYIYVVVIRTQSWDISRQVERQNFLTEVALLKVPGNQMHQHHLKLWFIPNIPTIFGGLFCVPRYPVKNMIRYSKNCTLPYFTIYPWAKLIGESTHVASPDEDSRSELITTFHPYVCSSILSIQSIHV